MSTKKSPTTVVPPDENVDLGQWRDKYAQHFASNEHVSLSPFKDFFGSKDCGCRLHIPAAGKERDDMNRKAEQEAQAKRCKILRGEIRETIDA